MKKLMTGLVLFSMALLVAPVSVKAADAGTGDDKILGTGVTDVDIEFEAADLTQAKPVNPDNPNVVANPEPGHQKLPEQRTDGLSFLYVTDNLTFEHAKISMISPKAYPATLIKPNKGSTEVASGFDWTKKFIIEIADGRGADAGGWELKASGKALEANKKSESDTPHQIDGAKLTWPTKGNKTTNSGEGNNGVTVNTDDTSVELGGKSSAALLSAAKQKCAGVTIMQFDPSNILLEVPANKARVTTYSTSVTWSLEDTAKS